MKTSSPDAALKSPTTHKLLRGVGYVEIPRASVKPPKGVATAMVPPKGIADGSEHIILSPSGSEHRAHWHAAEQAWLTGPEGTHLGFQNAYLSAHGWTYGHAVELEKKAAKK